MTNTPKGHCVLTRRQGEAVIITDKLTGEQIAVTYVGRGLRGGQIKIAFQASDRYLFARDNAKTGPKD